MVVNFIDKSIAENLNFTPTTRDLWLKIKECYEHSNASQLLEFHRILRSITQNDDSIVEYYNSREFGISCNFLNLCLIVLVVFWLSVPVDF